MYTVPVHIYGLVWYRTVEIFFGDIFFFFYLKWEFFAVNFPTLFTEPKKTKNIS